MIDIKAKLLAACNGHPAAEIPWPHRLLHDAVEHIDSQQARIEELEAGIRKHKEFFRVDTSYTQEDLKLWALLP